MNRNRIPCPKCSGTGVVERFAGYQNGVCFDCNGNGTMVVETRPSRGSNPRKVAQAVGDVVLAGGSVDKADAEAAFEIYAGIAPVQWKTSDYDRYNALGRFIGRII